MMLKILKTLAKPFYGTWIGKYPVFKQLFFLHKYLFEFLQSGSSESLVKTIYGFDMYVKNTGEVVERNLAISGVWEKHISEIIRNNLNPWDVFVDLGANIGYYSLLSSKVVWPNGKVISFEPSSKNYELLKKNVSLNHADNIVLHKLGVGNEESKLEILFSEKNPGATSLVKNGTNDGYEKETVDIVVPDKLLKGQKVDLIKMDIEGFEYNAILGMKEILKNNAGVKIIFEFSPVLYRFLNSDWKTYSVSLLKELEWLGFSLYDVNDLQKEIVDFDSFTSHLEGKQADIFCVKKC